MVTLEQCRKGVIKCVRRMGLLTRGLTPYLRNHIFDLCEGSWALATKIYYQNAETTAYEPKVLPTPESHDITRTKQMQGGCGPFSISHTCEKNKRDI